MDEIDGLGDSAGDLGREAQAATRMTEAFSAELRRAQGAMSAATHGLDGLERGFSGGVRRAIDSVVLDGGRLSDALGILGDAISRTAYNAAMRPVSDHFGGLLSQGVNALIGGFASAGPVQAFANGGIVSGATRFPMGGGTGLMGEAGPEAIMPLTRTPDGRLGVAASGGAGNVQVTMNITTPDVAGFRRSQGQVAAQFARAIGQASRHR